MSLRFLRVLAPTAVAVLVALAVLIVSATSAPSATARGREDRGRVDHCLNVVLRLGRGSAAAVSGSAAPETVSHFAVFRRTRLTADPLLASPHVGKALAVAGATTYDPSAAVPLERDDSRSVVYAVPATMALVTLPADCSSLPQFAGVGAYLALQALETGSGPGACLVSTQLEDSAPSGSFLPGATPPKPTKTLVVTQTVCKSEPVLSGYIGALGETHQSSGTQLALIPDGVSSISYTLADGHRFSVPVARNLATVPRALSLHTAGRRPTAAELGRQLAAHLPTSVIERGSGAYAIASLARPPSLISDILGSLSFLRRLLRSGPRAGGSSSTSGYGASCSARTHRCVAVTLTTTCNRHRHCQTSRTIHRYRYHGTKPPVGTTGPDTQPTAPIVARTNRELVRPPTKVTLVLSGPPHRQVTVLVSVSCFSRNSAEGSAGPPLQVAVPSRIPIALPSHKPDACDVGALVTSTQRGAVHVRVARG